MQGSLPDLDLPAPGQDVFYKTKFELAVAIGVIPVGTEIKGTVEAAYVAQWVPSPGIWLFNIVMREQRGRHHWVRACVRGDYKAWETVDVSESSEASSGTPASATNSAPGP